MAAQGAVSQPTLLRTGSECSGEKPGPVLSGSMLVIHEVGQWPDALHSWKSLSCALQRKRGSLGELPAWLSGNESD